MRSPRSRRWIAPSRSCRCCRAPERATHDYKRAGTSSLYAALDLATGKVIGRAARPPPRDRVRSSCRRSTARSPPSSTCTSCSTTAPRTRRRRSSAGWPPHPRFVLHFTPTSSVVAEPRRALVRRAHHQAAPPRRAPVRPRSSTPTFAPGSRPGTTTPPVRVDQDRRPDPRLDRHLLQPNQSINDTRRAAWRSALELAHAAEPAERLRLDLADPLRRDPELAADLAQRRGVAAAMP